MLKEICTHCGVPCYIPEPTRFPRTSVAREDNEWFYLPCCYSCAFGMFDVIFRKVFKLPVGTDRKNHGY